MLGAVTGLAVSTAVQYAVAKSTLPDGHDIVMSSGEPSEIMAEAQMKGIRAVFIIMVPLIALCGLGCFFLPNVVLEGDERRNADSEQASRRA
jgi:hypothetical protein